MTYILNTASPEGTELGHQLARICETEITKGQPDRRCATCAFRKGDHLPNNSAATLMSALKSCMERTPFWCHEKDQPCGGWLLMRFNEVCEAPWPHCDAPEDAPWVVTSDGVVVLPFSSVQY